MNKHQWKNIVTIFVCNIITGILISMVNVQEADLTQGVSSQLISSMFITYGVMFVLRYVLRVNERDLRTSIMNGDFLYYNDKSFNSNAADIQKLTIGTIFDACKELSIDKGAFVVSCISTIPMIIPAFSLIFKEFAYNRLAGCLSVLSLVITFVVTYLGDKLFKWNTHAKELKAKLQSVTADNFMNIMTIKFMGYKQFAHDRLVQAQLDAEPYMVPKKKYAWFRIADCTYVATFLGSIYLCKENIAMVSLIVMSSFHIERLANFLCDLTDLQSNIKAQEKIITKIDGSDPENKPHFEGCEIRDIEFGYEPQEGMEESDVTWKVSQLNIEKGKRYQILGKSGSGKSTLLNVFAGLLIPTKGDIRMSDVFYVSQNISALNDTLWNNLVGSNEFNVSEHEILELMIKTDLIDWFSKLSKGFDTLLGERGCNLSFGQMERINAIRTVLAMRYQPHKLFLIDEITANLDDKTKKEVIKLFNEECKPESTCIIVAHDPSYECMIDEYIIVNDEHEFTMIDKDTASVYFNE